MNVNLKYGKLIPQGETYAQFVSWAGGELNILLKAKLCIECEDITRDERIYDYYAFHDAINLCWKVRNTIFPS